MHHNNPNRGRDITMWTHIARNGLLNSNEETYKIQHQQKIYMKKKISHNIFIKLVKH